VSKILLVKFASLSTLFGGSKCRFQKNGGTDMAWKTPKVLEVPVGMEINMYACAVRKLASAAFLLHSM
jgi:coenzyme PQQ precursor peptide PqqA